MSALNPKVSLDQIVFKALYYRYKDFIVPVTTIGICIFLFVVVIMPQIQAWMAMRDTISGDAQKLVTLKENLRIITNLDDGKLDTYLETASSALPTDKDFGGILQALSTAAANAGTSLGDYNFQIGDLVGSDTKSSSGQLPLQLTIGLKGDLAVGKKFIEELKNQLPLSDVTSISVSSNSTMNISIVFYYAPLPKITFDDSMPLVTLSPKDEGMLKLLNQTESQIPLDNSSSQSAGLTQ